MSPFYEDDDIVLHLGDCADVLSKPIEVTLLDL